MGEVKVWLKATHFLFAWNDGLERNVSNKTENRWTPWTARSALSNVWDSAKCAMFACFQCCHRSEWPVFENTGPWCFLAGAGRTFIWEAGCLEPSPGARAPSRAEVMGWFFQPLARAPTKEKANQGGWCQKQCIFTNDCISIYLLRINISWKGQRVFIFFGSLKRAHLSPKQRQPCPDIN